MAYRNGATGLLSDYAHLRTLPALTSALLVGCSLYLFGGITDLTLGWINYTLTTQHAVIASLLVYMIAFASSETKSLENYKQWEMLLIAFGPVVMLAYQYIGFVADQFAANDPHLSIIAFVLSLISWGVMVR